MLEFVADGFSRAQMYGSAEEAAHCLSAEGPAGPPDVVLAEQLAVAEAAVRLGVAESLLSVRREEWRACGVKPLFSLVQLLPVATMAQVLRFLLFAGRGVRGGARVRRHFCCGPFSCL